MFLQRVIVVLAAGGLLAGASGCALIRKGAGSMMAPMAAGLSNSLQKQSDVELVRNGSPAFLLLLDGLLESSPDNPDLLLAAANAQTAYAMAFVGKDELPRARAMYEKARDYGLRVLRRNARFDQAWDKPIGAFESAMPSFRKRDVPALYATATAWSGWIISNASSMDAISQFSKPYALMRRVLELDPAYERGGADMFFGIFYAVQPHGAGRDLAKSKEHFEKAFAAAGPDYLLPRVTFAEFYARYAFDRELFEKTLNEALQPRADPPEFRLMNEVARARAKALLPMADEWF